MVMQELVDLNEELNGRADDPTSCSVASTH